MDTRSPPPRRSRSGVTSPEITVDVLRFYVEGSTPLLAGDHRQPQVHILLSGTAGSGVAAVKFNLQTTVTQRKIDI